MYDANRFKTSSLINFYLKSDLTPITWLPRFTEVQSITRNHPKILFALSYKTRLWGFICGVQLLTLFFPTAFTHRSPTEAGPPYLRDRCFLGATIMAGHGHLCGVWFSGWSVYLMKSLCCHFHKPFFKYTIIFRSNRRPKMPIHAIMCPQCNYQAQCDSW